MGGGWQRKPEREGGDGSGGSLAKIEQHWFLPRLAELRNQFGARRGARQNQPDAIG